MKVCFLGTGAADFSEGIIKDVSYGLNDKSVRRSTSTLIDDRILIDCGPHVFRSLSLFDKDASKIEHLIITHFHDDHFDLDNVKQLAAAARNPLNVWFNGEKDFPAIDNVKPHPLTAYEEYSVGEYKIVPHRANHTECPFHYEIKGDKTLYYALDGAWVRDETFRKIFGKYFDAFIVDATVGDYIKDERLASHNSIPMVRALVGFFRHSGVLKPDAPVFLDHIAITLNPSYGEQVKIAEKDGFTVSYDGMEVNI